jgi:predicted dehydrogenase
MLRVGAIGWRGHAGRMIGLVEASGMGRVEVAYHPRAVPPMTGGTVQFAALLDCDAVLILSPNDTHAAYLQQLGDAGYRGHVLCEKPPATTAEGLAICERQDPARTFFNFNYRFCRWRALAEAAIADGRLGTPIHADAVVTHGLAFKKDYPQSWRADGTRHRHGVLETVAIHFVDLFAALLGPVESCDYAPRLVSGAGTAFDTCSISARHGGGSSTILASYAAPYALRVALHGTNGSVVWDDQRITYHGPRDTLDTAGRSAAPPAEVLAEAGAESFYEDSLKRAVTFFLEHCRDGRPFAPDLFAHSLATNRLVLAAGA